MKIGEPVSPTPFNAQEALKRIGERAQKGLIPIAVFDRALHFLEESSEQQNPRFVIDKDERVASIGQRRKKFIKGNSSYDALLHLAQKPFTAIDGNEIKKSIRSHNPTIQDADPFNKIVALRVLFEEDPHDPKIFILQRDNDAIYYTLNAEVEFVSTEK